MMDHIGQKLDNYRLLKLLGRGSFAEVYQTEHVVHKTLFAIKIFNISLNQAGMSNMLDEIRNLIRLNNHPNIIKIKDFSVKPPIPFIVMDYAPNGTLWDRHPRGMPVPLETIIIYVKQIASALQYAHDEKLIHRDVKPANILIAQDGSLLLSDFGITIPSQSMRDGNKELQGRAGTADYMAPEQILYSPSRASDQYALAIIVYEWLTGYPPFVGRMEEVYGKQLHAVPAPLPPIIPSELAEVVMKALSKSSQDRYPTIQHFASAFEQVYNTILPRMQAPTKVEPPPHQGNDEQTIYISPEDDLTNVRERLEKIAARHISLIIPRQTLLRSHVAWRNLYARSKELGKDVMVISADAQIRSLAQAAKFRVAHSLESSAANKSRSRSTRAPRIRSVGVMRTPLIRSSTMGKTESLEPEPSNSKNGRSTSQSLSPSPQQLEEEPDLFLEDYLQSQVIRHSAQQGKDFNGGPTVPLSDADARAAREPMQPTYRITPLPTPHDDPFSIYGRCFATTTSLRTTRCSLSR